MIEECVITPPSKYNIKVNQELERIVLKALSKDLKLRYQDAGLLHKSLQEFLSRHSPSYGQREVAQLIQTVFSSEIDTEKKRFEQVYRQSIPFSQGAEERPKTPQDPLEGIEEELDGSVTRSEVEAETGATLVDHEVEGSSSDSSQAQSSASASAEEPDGQTKSSMRLTHSPSKRGTRGKASSKEGSKTKDRFSLIGLGGSQLPSGATQTPSGTKLKPYRQTKSESNTPTEQRTNLGKDFQTGSKTQNDYLLKPSDPISRSENHTRADQYDGPMHLGAGGMGLPADPAQERSDASRAREKRRLFPRSVTAALMVALGGYFAHLYLKGGVPTLIELVAPRGPTESQGESQGAEEGRSSGSSNASGDAANNPGLSTDDVCTLQIHSDRNQSQAMVDNRSLGQTPATYSGTCGKTVMITVEAPGFAKQSQSIRLEENSKLVDFYLVPLKAGTLRVESTGNANVFIDDRPVGQVEAGSFFERSVPAGKTYQVRLENKVYGTQAQGKVTVQENQVSTLKLKLSESPSSKLKKRR
jgi:hypothetical protein